MSKTNTLEKKVDAILIKIDTLATKGDLATLATKEDLNDLAISTQNSFRLIEEIDGRFDQVDKRFDHMDDRFDRIENISIGNQERRIENIEDDIRIIKTKVGIGKK